MPDITKDLLRRLLVFLGALERDAPPAVDIDATARLFDDLLDAEERDEAGN